MSDSLFYAPEIKTSGILSEQESQHCVKVLRMNEGDILTVTDGKGSFFDCKLIQAHTKHCAVSIFNERKQPKSWNFQLQLAFAPTKNTDRNEWFAEKATEIGIDRFTPLHCRYSERKELNISRLQKIVVSAMKQSQQAVMPVIDEMIMYDKFIVQPFAGRKFIAHCHESIKNTLPELYKKGEDVLILIGPEGDFSEEEVQKAIANGFEPISLGGNRLRTETACIVACHTIHILNMV